jgi:hypothetical protein
MAAQLGVRVSLARVSLRPRNPTCAATAPSSRPCALSKRTSKCTSMLHYLCNPVSVGGRGGTRMDKFQARRSKRFGKFANEMTQIKLCIFDESTDAIFRRLDELLAKYEEITKGDMYATLEIRRRVAECRVLASILKRCAVDEVEKEFQVLEVLGYSDIYTKATYHMIIWRFMADKAIRDKARTRLASVRTEVRRAMSMLKDVEKSLDDFLK